MASATAMQSSRSPRIRLILDTAKGNGAATPTVAWNPTSVLRGTLEIASVRSFEINEATIFLEGISRNWMIDSEEKEIIRKFAKAERIFLSQTLDISHTMIEQATMSPEGFYLAIPFQFYISKMIASSNTTSPSHCLQLPPSVELGRVIIDESSGKRFAQPSISYQVRAIVEFTEEEQEPAKPAETSVEIVIMPHTEELPPTDTKDFPAEFRLRESKPIRWSSFGRSLGTLTVSMQEPRALTYDLPSAQALTEGCIILELESPGLVSVYQSLKAISLTVLSLIRVKTFYSIKAFPRLPSQSLLSVHGGTRLRDDLIKLETRNVPSVAWSYKYDITEDFGEIGKSGRGFNEDLHVRNCRPSFKSMSKSSLQIPQGKWIAEISHPMRIDSRLLPTFCSSIVARLYSIILRVKVSGAGKQSFDLEIPLQVVHSPPKSLSDDATRHAETILGPTRGNNSLLELHRASETLWFDDESLESEELPPRYRP